MAYVGTPRRRGNDLETLASILQGEAGGEGLLGLQAVADVIRNRAGQNFSGYGGGLLDQALARNQFQGQSSKIGPEAMAVAEQLVSGKLPDAAGTAVYYANPGASTASWARNLNSGNALKIGNHYFTDNAQGKPFAASAYAGMADGPKGQESYPDPQTTAGILGGPHAPQGIIGDPSLGSAVSSALNPDEKSPLQKMFAGLAQYPDAPTPRLGPMGDARSSGSDLLKLLASLRSPRNAG
jgi:hypothetical protein